MTKIAVAVVHPDQTPWKHAYVAVRLVDAGTGGAVEETVISGTQRIKCDNTGQAELDLTPNDEITPGGTFYAITVEGSSPTTIRTIEVPQPNGTGEDEIPYSWADETIQVLVDTPPVYIPAPAPGDANKYIKVNQTSDGFDLVTSTGDGAELSDDDPAALGVVDAGVSDEGARSDHVHPMPTAAQVGAPSGSGTSTGTNTGDQDLSGYATTTALNAKVEDTVTDGVTTKAPSQNAVYDGIVNAIGIAAADATAKADAKVADAINNGTTTVAPSQNAVFDALALKEATANKGAASGYPALDTGAAVPQQYTPPPAQVGAGLRAWQAAVANQATTTAVGMIVTDSLGSFIASNPRQTSYPALVEAALMERVGLTCTDGYVPHAEATYLSTYDGRTWETGAGVRGGTYPSGKGPAGWGTSLAVGQFATFVGTGDGVIIDYTKRSSSGASLSIVVNGGTPTVVSTTGTAGSGYTQFVANPSGFGAMTVVVTATGSGNAYLDGAYATSGNSTTGLRFIQAAHGGWGLTDFIASTSTLECITRQQPSVVVTCLGINDYFIHGVTTPAGLVALLTTWAAAVRACYSSNDLVSLVYVFQPELTDAGIPATWSTTFRTALRQACDTLGIVFVDTWESVGAYGTASDPYNLAPIDHLHPGDKGHALIAGPIIAALGSVMPAKKTLLRTGAGTDAVTLTTSGLTVQSGITAYGKVQITQDAGLGTGAGYVRAYAEIGDTQPTFSMGTVDVGGNALSGLSFGPGGSTGADVQIRRVNGTGLTQILPNAAGVQVLGLAAADAALGAPIFSIASAATNDDPIETVYQFRSQTANATPKNIALLPFTASTVTTVEVDVTCHRTTTTQVGGGFKRIATYSDAGAGVPVLIGSITSVHTAASSTQAVTLVVSGSSIAVQVTGVASETYTWHVTARVRPVGT